MGHGIDTEPSYNEPVLGLIIFPSYSPTRGYIRSRELYTNSFSCCLSDPLCKTWQDKHPEALYPCWEEDDDS